jgi:hypothetical protein
VCCGGNTDLICLTDGEGDQPVSISGSAGIITVNTRLLRDEDMLRCLNQDQKESHKR